MTHDVSFSDSDAGCPAEIRLTPLEQDSVEAQIAAMREVLQASEAAEKAIDEVAGSGVILDLGQLPAMSDFGLSVVQDPVDDAPTKEGASYYCVRAKSFGWNKASLQAAVRELTGLEFFEVVKLVERVPEPIMYSALREDAEWARERLESAGAPAEVICLEKAPSGAALTCKEPPKDDDYHVKGFYRRNDVILEDAGKNMGVVSRVVHNLTGQSIIAVMGQLKTTPLTVLADVDALKASRARLSLELAGAKVSVRPSKKQ